jgi:hypothetical protein
VIQAVLNKFQVSQLSLDSRKREAGRNDLLTWFPTFKRIGEESVNGMALLSPIIGYIKQTNIDTVLNSVIIKFPMNHSEPIKEIHREYMIGLELNKLRDKVPNFGYMFGKYECNTVNPKGNLTQQMCSTTQNIKVPFCIMQFIKGKSLRDILPTISKHDMTIILLQLFLALDYAYKKVQFQHNDLHPGNVLIITLSQPMTLHYPFKNQYITISTKYIPVIIDYGRSSIFIPEENKLYPATGPDYSIYRRDIPWLVKACSYNQPFLATFFADKRYFNETYLTLYYPSPEEAVQYTLTQIYKSNVYGVYNVNPTTNTISLSEKSLDCLCKNSMVSVLTTLVSTEPKVKKEPENAVLQKKEPLTKERRMSKAVNSTKNIFLLNNNDVYHVISKYQKIFAQFTRIMNWCNDYSRIFPMCGNNTFPKCLPSCSNEVLFYVDNTPFHLLEKKKLGEYLKEIDKSLFPNITTLFSLLTIGNTICVNDLWALPIKRSTDHITSLLRVIIDSTKIKEENYNISLRVRYDHLLFADICKICVTLGFSPQKIPVAPFNSHLSLFLEYKKDNVPNVTVYEQCMKKKQAHEKSLIRRSLYVPKFIMKDGKNINNASLLFQKDLTITHKGQQKHVTQLALGNTDVPSPSHSILYSFNPTEIFPAKQDIYDCVINLLKKIIRTKHGVYTIQLTKEFMIARTSFNDATAKEFARRLKAWIDVIYSQYTSDREIEMTCHYLETINNVSYSIITSSNIHDFPLFQMNFHSNNAIKEDDGLFDNLEIPVNYPSDIFTDSSKISIAYNNPDSIEVDYVKYIKI